MAISSISKIDLDMDVETLFNNATGEYARLIRYGRMRVLEFDCSAYSLNGLAISASDAPLTHCYSNSAISAKSSGNATYYKNALVIVNMVDLKIYVRYWTSYNVNYGWSAPTNVDDAQIRGSVMWIV